MSGGRFGSCASELLSPLRWSADRETGNRICCHNRDRAEVFGSFASTEMPRELPEGTTNITFYDSVTAKPLFIAPQGRSYADFIAESDYAGWPSFTIEEAIVENVRIVHPHDGSIFSSSSGEGEVCSKDGTHLGHLLIGGRSGSSQYLCINVVCITGSASATASSTSLDGLTIALCATLALLVAVIAAAALSRFFRRRKRENQAGDAGEAACEGSARPLPHDRPG